MKRFFSKLTLLALPLLLVLGIGFTVLAPTATYAAPQDEVKNGLTASGASSADTSTGKNGTFRKTFQNIISTLLFIIGIIGVIVIVIAGIQYATSGGNAEQASKAKNSIIYAVVGIIVAVMAYAIVGFVIGNI